MNTASPPRSDGLQPPSPSQAPLTGKAANLHALQHAGFPVPEFLTSPEDLQQAVTTLGFPLAVRSSASAEDGTEASFAGQFRSFLNLSSLSEVEDAVAKCRASASSPAVREYCSRSGIDGPSIQMDVIVQRMVRPDLAGVAFSVNPVTGADEVVIEAVAGIADELLAGNQRPLPADHPLVQKHGAEIRSTARAIQSHFGTPQDIEFAIAEGRLFILQTRPITRIQFAAETGIWTNADFRDGGVSCTVCTPLMWSLYDYIWEDALKGFLRDIKLLRGDFQAGRMFFGRPYWNLGEVKKCLAQLPGFVERKFDEDLGVEPIYDGDGIRTPVSFWKIVRALPSVFAIGRIWKRQEKVDGELLDRGFTSGGDLRKLIEFDYRKVETEYFRTIFCASLAKMDFTDSFPEADYAALAAGLPPLRHLGPVRAMAEMKRRGETDIAPLIERFRHRSRRELDLRAPRWDEDHEWVQSLFDRSPSEDPATGEATYKEALSKTLASLPRRKHRSFQNKLGRLRRFLWLREEMRDLSTHTYYHVRRQILRIARARSLGDDIFFMTFQEVFDDDRSGIGRGREIFEAYRNFSAPNEIGSKMVEPTSEDGLQGIAASRGIVRGKAWVARNIEEAMGAGEGDILVCPSTDPGWTPVLARVAGVVTETGGMLSHAAVICREFGIPAVLGVSGATRRIVAEMSIVVRGDVGLVEIGGDEVR